MQKRTLSFAEYRDKVLGCWHGKNIGGTLGAPFECLRGVFDIDFYTQELGGEPLPNDDLDLQLVWLNAAERFGSRIDAQILGEYWHWFITPHWAEYGAGRNNMRAGMLPPLSGYVNNRFRDSCGAFILSEIWACLVPGDPEGAARYAFEDACVDHAGEGLYAEVFCAAVESAAFVVQDTATLIDIGLSYIPENCGVSRAVRCVQQSHAEGLDWREARRRLLIEEPGSFGAMGTPREQMDPDIPVAEPGYDAPSNIGIIIIGWLYGGGDLGRSICIAAGCGEDADCTAGTLGALLGILHGGSALPEKWLAPLGGKIKTKCINVADVGLRIPATVDELTDRLLRLTPTFLGPGRCDVLSGPGYTVTVRTPEEMFCRERAINAYFGTSFFETLSRSPFVVRTESTLYTALLDYGGEPFIRAGEPRTLRLTVVNGFLMQQWLRIRWHCPADWTVTPGRMAEDTLESYYCNEGKTTFTFTFTAETLTDSRFDLAAEISSVGHHTRTFVPVTLYAR